ncbi:MAG: hypothetical protein MJ211_09350 [Bacteroidales bacterium]|nr:hypothetical protein [Bacteroidales bacterium]
MFSNAFITLGQIFNKVVYGNNDKNYEYYTEVNNLLELVNSYYNYNGWFSSEFVKMQLKSLTEMLNENEINNFANKYQLNNIQLSDKKVKIISAGNIPLVCFHDIFCVLVSGFKLVIKYSSKDKLLPMAVLSILSKIEPQLKDRIEEETGTNIKFDAIIATGNNNSGRYFDYYFSKYPNIIRKNRNSVAVLTGNETEEDFKSLANDIFAYYGLGCRSVSKIYVPQGYDYNIFFKNILFASDIINNAKYSDNYDYNKAVYLMSDAKILDNGFLLLKQDRGMSSPVGVLFCEEYQNLEQLGEYFNDNKELLQCVVSQTEIPQIKTVCFGQAQHPKLNDFADGVDTIEFLKSII